jgi:hypothetical protein
VCVGCLCLFSSQNRYSAQFFRRSELYTDSSGEANVILTLESSRISTVKAGLFIAKFSLHRATTVHPVIHDFGIASNFYKYVGARLQSKVVNTVHCYIAQSKGYTTRVASGDRRGTKWTSGFPPKNVLTRAKYILHDCSSKELST